MTIKIDLGNLKQVGDSLQAVAADFADANVQSDGIATACGHAHLDDTVTSFAHGWDDKRKKMADGIKGLGEAASTVADQFSDFDQQFAAALTSSGEGA